MPRRPTPAELDRHRRAVAKLRAELFRAHSPQALRIDTASEVIRAPYISSRAGEAPTLGGLEYRAESDEPGESFGVSVSHDKGDIFTIHISAHRATGFGCQSWVVFAVTRRFKEVADTVAALLTEARRKKVSKRPV